MGTTRLPDRIPIPSAIKRQERLFGFGGFVGLIAIGGFVAGNAILGFLAGSVAALLFWVGSKIKTHKIKIIDGGVYE